MEDDSPWGDVPSRNQSTSTPTTPATEAPPSPDTVKSSVTSPKPNDAPAASTKKPARGPHKARRFGTQSTTLEALDDGQGPLGPLGGDTAAVADDPPAPPQKESSPAAMPGRAPKPAPLKSGASSLRGMMESVNLEDEDAEGLDRRPRIPPPVDPPTPGEGQRRATPGSVSVEQAAKPTFEITVGDPHKVGDLTSSHTVYQVRTKVRYTQPPDDGGGEVWRKLTDIIQTSSKAYRNPEFTVSRRYRDFLWLFNQLHANNPGVVVPPPPEKQAVGRFDQNFVESRRQALERMLNKTTAHPILQHDGDLKLFLESESFNVDIKHKERKDVGLPETKGGMLSSIGLSVGGGTKFIEHDDWFHDRRIYLDALENQLKALLKSTDAVVAQRKALAESCSDFSNSLHSLALVELSPSLSGPLDGLSDVQLRIRDLNDRQAQQDVLTLGIVIDEYIRLIGSIKTAFTQRQKAFHAWHSAESSLAKLKASQDKLMRAGRTQQDRLSQMQADVGDAERRVHQARLLFEDMGRLMRGELERFEREKVEDFKSGVETFLESAVEAQKELIEIWETYLMQLDAEEDGGAPFAGVALGSNGSQNGESQAGKAAGDAEDERPVSRATDASETLAASSTTDDDGTESRATTARDEE
ncbi:putative vacuolar protein sorting-associated protein vps5 [Elsinoe australis]|uniref:Putative vacuolar protein sorting-associated protein vps5 n=1 Tax=Elsinoe australis TaxID=40998 RepID=A0A4U7BFQ9_9PEZI|nr:putative vacuolar protein sorting-associated protein vps5 [Elsinoe australis]